MPPEFVFREEDNTLNDQLKRMLQEVFGEIPPHFLLLFVKNEETDRVYYTCSGSRERIMHTMYNLTTPIRVGAMESIINPDSIATLLAKEVEKGDEPTCFE